MICVIEWFTIQIEKQTDRQAGIQTGTIGLENTTMTYSHNRCAASNQQAGFCGGYLKAVCEQLSNVPPQQQVYIKQYRLSYS